MEAVEWEEKAPALKYPAGILEGDRTVPEHPCGLAGARTIFAYLCVSYYIACIISAGLPLTSAGLPLKVYCRLPIAADLDYWKKCLHLQR